MQAEAARTGGRVPIPSLTSTQIQRILNGESVDHIFQQQSMEQQIARDRWGRPMIVPPGGGKAIAYTRASTLAKALDDQSNLVEWKARMAGRGVAIRPDLQAGFAALTDMDDPEQKRTARELAEQATEAAGASFKRTVGTAIHGFTETHDRGQQLQNVPPALQPLIARYIQATNHVRWLAFEQFVVTDEIQAAGTADRIGQEGDGPPRIYDLKTGSVSYGAVSFACQLAIYAHGQIMRVNDGSRVPFPAMDLTVGTIIHADQSIDPETGQPRGTVDLYDVDLEFGWWAVERAIELRKIRKRKDVMVKRPEQPSGPSMMEQIFACATLDDLRALYRSAGATWTVRHRKAADARATELKEVTVG